MRMAFAVFLLVHGLIHVLGFAKAAHFAELPQLTRPISVPMGVLWLAAALLFVVTAAALFVWQRWWFAVGAMSIAVSMMVILPSWADAKFGAVANVIALVGVVFGFLVDG